MLITAEQKNTRQTSRKVRLVANSVRKMPLKKAIQQLAVVERKASIVVMKVMRQAVANAAHNHGLKPEDLELENIIISEGPTYKRFRAVSRGRAHTIFKRTCHVKVILKTTGDATIASTKKAAPKKEKAAKKKTVKKATSKTATKTSKKATPATQKAHVAKSTTKKSVAKTKNVINRTTNK